MKMQTALALRASILIIIIAFLMVLSMRSWVKYLSSSGSGDYHIDQFCGTITGKDGSIDHIKVTIAGQDELSLDFRSNPGKLSLRRCKNNSKVRGE